jgi:hypothetical protein
VERIKGALGRQLDVALAQLTDHLKMTERFDVRILSEPRFSPFLSHGEWSVQWYNFRAGDENVKLRMEIKALGPERGPYVGELDVTVVDLEIATLFRLDSVVLTVRLTSSTTNATHPEDEASLLVPPFNKLEGLC